LYKGVYTAFVAVLIPVYWMHHGPENFLWFSDIALFATLIAVWIENRLLVSMMAVGVLLPEIAWCAGFFVQLLGSGGWFLGAVEYMFDPRLPAWLRALSLFHLGLPPLLIVLVRRWGYDRRALVAQTLLAWAVMLLAYFLTHPSGNVNWVHGWGYRATDTPKGLPHLACVMIGLPVLIFLPTHGILIFFFGRSRAHAGQPA